MTTRRLAAALAASLAGCAGTAGPDYARPPLDLPAAMPGAAAGQSAPPADAWWRTFGDAELDRLVADARAGNLGLRETEARIRAARALAARAGTASALRVDASAGWQRSRSSERSVSGAAARFGDVADPEDTTTLAVDASWEPDLFGRVRRGVEAAEADAEAALHDRRALEVALAADVADAWFDAGAATAEAAVHRETIDLLEQTLRLARARFDAGAVSELDVRRTESDLAAARSLLPDAERRHAVAENRLALLLGRAPGLRASARPPSAFGVPAEVPVGLPADLLERRPDVRAAEARLVATNARAGQAVADFYPRVRIAGRAGFSAVEPEDVLRWGSRLWSIGPSVTLPVLDGGEREFRLLEAEALRDAATAAWMETVLRALNEVGDAMVSLDAARRTREAVRGTIAAGSRSVELADIRYREGVTGYVEVLDAQRVLARAKLDLLAAERAVLTHYVRLHRALGGGWRDAATGSDTPRP